MFYQESTYQAFRFGDVLKGFVIATPSISDPSQIKQYNIEVNHPEYCVILSPCCSIGKRIITLSPLIQLQRSFFNNKYFEEDLTRINREMEAWEAVPSLIWKEKFTEEERQKKLREGKAYAFNEIFIYEQNVLFTNYELDVKGRGKIVTNYYMIDFRNTFKVYCDKIISNENSPIELKCLQLSIDTRKELREKLASYYSRIPEEDKILED